MATILIVDDQAEILQVYSRALEIAGYDVRIAATAEAALKLVEEKPPDAILLDLAMPYINGMGFLYRLRKGHPRMPVAIVTGSTNLDTAAIREIGMLDASLHFKPLSVIELHTVVDGLTRKA
jgi:DNA-binding NtrC family response regulator